ncbi:MAG: immune inhibitor A, partial [Bacteroidales bacterium]|nr:immune inhibitor A [Bacteroidales bacterium]
NTILDNVQLNPYSCSSELYDSLNCDGIGPICHEMGHVLGLPDFYDTDYSGTGGTSIEVMYWDVMSSGGYNNNCITPPYLSTVERNLLGWLNPTLISANNNNCILPAISDSNMAYKINLQDDEFLIFEYRNKKKWDAYTPGKGMLVFHGDQIFIDNWIIGRNNTINANPFDRGLFIIPSSGDSTNNDSDSTTFPGSRNINSLLNINHKNGNPTGINLTNICYTSDSTITFNLTNVSPNISIFSPTNITMNSATLNGSAIGTDITSMGFEYRMVGDTAYTSQTISSSAMQFNLTNLLAGTTYEYRVFGIKNSITYYTSIMEFNTICLTNLSIPYSQGFEVATLPCWDFQSSNNNFISIETLGNVPYCLPHSGNRMIKYGSGYLEYGNWATITTPVINIPHQYHQFSFWIYRLSGSYSSPNEGVEIYINSNNDLNGATLLGYISNNRNTTPIETSDGWYNYSFNLPSGTYGNKYFIIKTLSDFGYNIYIDDISITPYLTQIPPMVFIDSISTSYPTTFYGTYIKGTDEILTKGFEYKTNTSTTWDTIFSQTNETHFSASLTNLLQNTLYNVRAFTVTQTEGTTYSIIDTFLNQNLGINSIGNNPIKMLLYPNPTTNTTNLIIEGISKETRIIISDIQGRVINSFVSNPINSKIVQEIDCSTLSKGIYFINIINSTINNNQKLIIK